MTLIAGAGPNASCTDAIDWVARAGGSAADAAVAATLVAMVSEPGIVSLAGGAFVMVGTPDRMVTCFDGNVTVPTGADRGSYDPRACWQVQLEYGAGTSFFVGPGTAAVPGALGALGKAHAAHGCLRWSDVCSPAIATARDGFALSPASAEYLGHAGGPVYGWDERSRAMMSVLSDEGSYSAGTQVALPALAQTLEHFASAGPRDAYTGEFAGIFAAEQARTGGFITASDLAVYEVVQRTATWVDLAQWSWATNPPPAIGGTVLAALLQLRAHKRDAHPDKSSDALWAETLAACVYARGRDLDEAVDLDAATRETLRCVSSDPAGFERASASTVHLSAVDSAGLSVAITASSGYGSGAMIGETNVVLNNCLGEPELNRRGLFSRSCGDRLATNMAPTIGYSRAGDVLAIGSPGADRITSALAQVIWRLAHECDLAAAITAPRLHAARQGGQMTVHAEPGAYTADAPAAPYCVQQWPRQAMYFGGVGIAARGPDGSLRAASDPRRGGAAGVFGS